MESLPGNLLDGWKPFALRGVRHEYQDDGRADQSGDCGKDEAELPAQRPDHYSDYDKGEELTYIRGRTEYAVVCPPLRQREPSGKLDDSGRGTHGLRPAVYTPYYGEDEEYQQPPIIRLISEETSRPVAMNRLILQ